jgi:2,5-furandicarboxylate decarboxylase 1
MIAGRTCVAPGHDRPDLERFRLRTFVEELRAAGELAVHPEPVDLVDLARHLDGNPKAVLFERVGPEGAAVVGNVMGSRRRLALALGVAEQAVLPTLVERLRHPIAPREVPSADCPVHEVVLTGDAADLTRLPVHLQHGRDGGPYLSAALDFAVDSARGWTNVGCRRLMLRGRRETGVDLNAPGDLRALYLAAQREGRPLPVAFAIGSHPLDYIGATCLTRPMDELAILGALRGEPVPIARGVTVDVPVPADAEMVLEGYVDARGFVEREGPYGEFLGYYGGAKLNPVFHLTAITARRDALFQTATIGGRALARTDTAQLCGLRTEASVWAALEAAIREPVAVYVTPASGGNFNVRVAIRQRYPGEARNAIAAVFASIADAKHVFVLDDDIDVFSDEQLDWALATRSRRGHGVPRGAAGPVAWRQPHRGQGGLRPDAPVRRRSGAGVRRARAPYPRCSRRAAPNRRRGLEGGAVHVRGAHGGDGQSRRARDRGRAGGAARGRHTGAPCRWPVCVERTL